MTDQAATIPDRLQRLHQNLVRLLDRVPRIAAYVRGWDEDHPGAWAGELLELFDTYVEWANEQDALSEFLMDGYLELCRSNGGLKAATSLGFDAESCHEAAGKWAGAELERLDFIPCRAGGLLWSKRMAAHRNQIESTIPASKVELLKWAEGMNEEFPAEVAKLKLELRESLRLCSARNHERAPIDDGPVTLQQLADLSGIPISTLYHWTDGRPPMLSVGRGKGGKHTFSYLKSRAWILSKSQGKSMELPLRYSDAAAILQGMKVSSQQGNEI